MKTAPPFKAVLERLEATGTSITPERIARLTAQPIPKIRALVAAHVAQGALATDPNRKPCTHVFAPAPAVDPALLIRVRAATLMLAAADGITAAEVAAWLTAPQKSTVPAARSPHYREIRPGGTVVVRRRVEGAAGAATVRAVEACLRALSEADLVRAHGTAWRITTHESKDIEVAA